jgi:hypothetical protein
MKNSRFVIGLLLFGLLVGLPGLDPASGAAAPGFLQDQVEPDPPYLRYLEPYDPYLPPVTLPEVVQEVIPDTGALENPTLPLAALAGDPPARLLLPDLVTLPPYHLRVIVDRSANRKILRFTNAIANLGEGPLELRGMHDHASGEVAVEQYIYLEDRSVLTAPVGVFHFHDIHNHWHWDGFSLYEVWSVITPSGELDELLYSSDKVGYCLRDDALADPLWTEAAEILGENTAAERTYLSCGVRRQGLSTGWTDVYAHNTPGQYVDISGLDDGTYVLRSVTDPYNIIYEASNEHNEYRLYFQLEGDRVTVLE